MYVRKGRGQICCFIQFLFENKKSNLNDLKPLANETSWFHVDCAFVCMLRGLRKVSLSVNIHYGYKHVGPSRISVLTVFIQLLMLSDLWVFSNIIWCFFFMTEKVDHPKAVISYEISLLNDFLEAPLVKFIISKKT